MKISYCRQGKRKKKDKNSNSRNHRLEKDKLNMENEIQENVIHKKNRGLFSFFKFEKKMNFKFIKKTQIIVIIITLMIMLAAYYNYSDTNSKNIVDLSVLYDTEKYAGIGDATLVNGKATSENTENSETLDSNIDENNKNKNNKDRIDKEAVGKVEDNQYYVQSRLEREKMYSEMLETYNLILNNGNVSNEQKAIAENEIVKISNYKNGIMISENLIKSKGFNDVIIFTNDQNVTVVIKAEKLNEEDIAQIQNIVMRELKADVENIHISTKEK